MNNFECKFVEFDFKISDGQFSSSSKWLTRKLFPTVSGQHHPTQFHLKMLKLAFNHPLPPRRLKRCTCMRFWRMCHSHQTLGLMVCVNVFAISVGIFALIELYNLFMKLKRKSECFRVHFVHITYTAWEKVFYVADNLMKNSAAWQRFPATVFG